MRVDWSLDLVGNPQQIMVNVSLAAKRSVGDRVVNVNNANGL